MNARIIVFSAVLFLVMGFASTGLGLSADSAVPEMDQPATHVELGAEINNLVFTGMVKRIPNGMALVTKNGTYLLEGGNFDSIIDKEVNVIGKLVKQGSIEVIEVARTQLAHE